MITLPRSVIQSSMPVSFVENIFKTLRSFTQNRIKQISLLLIAVPLIGAATPALAQSISIDNDYTDIALTTRSYCALTTAGDIRCGVDSVNSNQLLPPEQYSGVQSIAVGSANTCVILAGNQLRCWGDSGFAIPDVPAAAQNALAVSIGESHACAINTDGNAVCWGSNDNGRATPPDPLQTYTQIVAGNVQSCAVRTDGGVDCWGADDGGASTVPSGLSEVQGLDADRFRNCAVTAAGDIQCWGAEGVEFNVPDSGPYVAVAQAGFRQRGWVCGLTQSGVADCRFTNSTFSILDDAQVARIEQGIRAAGPFTSITALSTATPNQFNLCGVNTNGQLECWEALDDLVFPGGSGGMLFVPEINAQLYSATTIELLWPAERPANGSSDIAGFEILRDGEVIAFSQAGASYLDDTLEEGIVYQYAVRAVSNSGVQGELSNAIEVNTAQRAVSDPAEGQSGTYQPPVRPLTPTNLQALIYSANTLELTWDRAAISAQGYEIYRNGEFFGFTAGTSFFIDSETPDSNVSYMVIGIGSDDEIGGFATLNVRLGDALQCF